MSNIGDCLDILPTLDRESVDLVLTDPPYGIGIDYGFGPQADRRDDYDIWCGRWINWCYRALKPHGSLWIISGQEHGADIDIAIQRTGMTMRNRITWHETFGVQCQRKFARTSRPIYYAVKDAKKFTFNRAAVTVPSDRQTKYGYTVSTPHPHVVVYDVDKCIEILIERDGISHEEADEYLSFNTLCCYVGENTPLFVKVVRE